MCYNRQSLEFHFSLQTPSQTVVDYCIICYTLYHVQLIYAVGLQLMQFNSISSVRHQIS